MCTEIEKSKVWHGWIDVPPGKAGTGEGAWLDLSHPLTADLSRSPAFPQPVFSRLLSMPEGSANITMISMVCHHGTHLDAPSHVIVRGPTIDTIPLDRLYGEAVVWKITPPPGGALTAQQFEDATPSAQRGDIVVLDTGTAQHMNTPAYEEHPWLSVDAAQWLVDHGVKMVCVDFTSPDLPLHRRPPGFAWPAHHVLLGHGVLIVEHVKPPPFLAGKRVEFSVNALNLVGSDGAPARPMARPVRETRVPS